MLCRPASMPIKSGQAFAWQPPVEPGQAGRESCTMTAIISGGAGGVLGMLLGAVMAPFNSNLTQLENQDLPLRQQMRLGMREVGTQSRSWGKNLMVIGAAFSCSECFVEKTRGRTDRWNPIIGGCITGGALAFGGALPVPPHVMPNVRLTVLWFVYARVPQPARKRWRWVVVASRHSPLPSTLWALDTLTSQRDDVRLSRLSHADADVRMMRVGIGALL